MKFNIKEGKEKTSRKIYELFSKYLKVLGREVVKPLSKQIIKEIEPKDTDAMFNMVTTNLIFRMMETIAGQGEKQKEVLKNFVEGYFNDKFRVEKNERPIYIG